MQDQLTFLRGTNISDILTIEIDEKDLLDKVSSICRMFLKITKKKQILIYGGVAG